MKHQYLKNVALKEAVSQYISELTPLNKTENVAVQDALSRITAKAVYAKISSPHYNACAMDGIALNAQITYGATETTPVELEEHIHFKRVDTGDTLPTGLDAVVMIEEVVELESGRIRLHSAATPWQHIRQVGEDICANEMLLPSYTRLEASALGALLAGGIMQVEVLKTPIVGIIPTGDEIVSPTQSPKDGEIIEFNSTVFSSMLRGYGASTVIYPIVPDSLESIKAAILKATAECDLVIVNAGSSAGSEDYTEKAVSQIGRVLLHGIAIRPGKPTILGIVNNCPTVGVPGYPVSGIIVLDKLIKPVLEHISGIQAAKPKKASAVLTRRLVSSLKYKEFIRVKLGAVDDKLIAIPLNRGAGVVTSFVRADGILEIPQNSEGTEAGSEVEVELLRDEQEIKNTLVITGSHDQLLDVVTDIFKTNYKGMYAASAHVGSMGGIMALKKQECHIAGIHLLDEATGQYNISFIERYLNKDDFVLVKGVKRLQGIIVQKGNPLNIKGLEDLTRVSYVNRQRGSGTRLLLDYMLKNKGIEQAAINGYGREEYTHLSVAVQIASGSAQAGMGVYAAANIYDLGFIPICYEEYDFVIAKKYFNTIRVQSFIEILKSQGFKNALDGLGGYSIEGTGEIIDMG